MISLKMISRNRWLLYRTKMGWKSVFLFDKIYETKKDFRFFVKNLIYETIGICNDVKGQHPNHYITLIEILKRHPDWCSKSRNICNLEIVQDEWNKNALKIFIINNNKSKIDISWNCAINGKLKTNKNQLLSALRSSVDEQIWEFRINNKNKCALCNKITTNIHVDHIKPFHQLVKEFVEQYDSIPKEFGHTSDNTHRRCFLEKNYDFKNDWIQYHYRNASLRILCNTCNLKRKY